MVFVQQGFSSNLLVFNSYFGWLYYVQWEIIPPLCSMHYSRTERNECCGARYTSPIERQCVSRVPLHSHKLKWCRVAGPASLFTNRNGSVLKVPLTVHKWKGPCVAGPSALRDLVLRGPAALFTNGKDSVLRGPRHYSQKERTVCCGAHGSIHKWKGRCVAGPTALFTNGKDGVLRVPSAQGHMDRPQLDLLEDGNGLLMSEAGHRATVHRENFIT